MRRRLAEALATTAVLAAPAVVPAGVASTAALQGAGCLWGRVPPALNGLEQTNVALAQRRFAAAERGLSRSRLLRAEATVAAGIAAYVYGVPAVLVRQTVQRFPLNALIGIGALATPAGQAVVAPNHDTLYSTARLDLGPGPLIIDAPGATNRYSILQLIDAYSNDFAYIGAAPGAVDSSSIALVGPAWRGALPAGLHVLQSPTRLVWLLGRTLASGPADVSAATELLRGYAVTPLVQWVSGARRHALVLSQFPRQAPVTVPPGLGFYDELGTVLAEDPPPASDRCALLAFAKAGIGAGLVPSRVTDPVLRRALADAATAGSALVDAEIALARSVSSRQHHGWLMSPADVGRFGTDYAQRAMTARSGLASNVRSQAIYPTATTDSTGHELDGRHRYTIKFLPGQRPPVLAFWSLTLYNDHTQLWANPLNRYSIGDRTPGLHYGRDGSLTIYVQHARPSAQQVSNWLPAPAARFKLWLRLYEPAASAINGRWEPPPVIKAAG